MAGLLLGWQASIIITIASILSGFGLAYAEQSGMIGNVSYPATAFAQDITFIFGLNSVLIYLLISGLENEIKNPRANLKELELSNINLNTCSNRIRERHRSN